MGCSSSNSSSSNSTAAAASQQHQQHFSSSNSAAVQQQQQQQHTTQHKPHTTHHTPHATHHTPRASRHTPHATSHSRQHTHSRRRTHSGRQHLGPMPLHPLWWMRLWICTTAVFLPPRSTNCQQEESTAQHQFSTPTTPIAIAPRVLHCDSLGVTVVLGIGALCGESIVPL